MVTLPLSYPASLILIALTLTIGLLVAIVRVAPASARSARLAAAAWLVGSGGLAAAGALSFETMPPTMLLLIGAVTVLTVLIARGRTGGLLAHGLPLAVLVGYQGFRIPVELWLHRGYVEGVFPVQMTFSGLNFDILTGISALAVAGLVHRGLAGRRLVLAWNTVGLGLLLTIVTIAVLSAPLPFQRFTDGPANVYVTGFPGIWLPTVLVQMALLGHLLVFRRLLGERATGPSTSGGSGAPAGAAS